MTKEEICYQVNKTVSRVSSIADDALFTQKKVTLRPEEAKLLLARGAMVYREELTRPDGGKFSRLFCYITLEQLIKASK